jgi:hypothetical protein
MKYIFIAVSSLLVFSTSHAADWKLVETNDALTLYADMASLGIDGSIRSTWFKVFFKPQTVKVIDKYVSYLISKPSFDCRNNTVNAGTLAFYFADNTQNGAPADNEWRPVIPDTLLETQFRYLCRMKVSGQ